MVRNMTGPVENIGAVVVLVMILFGASSRADTGPPPTGPKALRRHVWGASHAPVTFRRPKGS